jgi:hypothetical protein
MKTLKEALQEHVLHALRVNEFNRKKTATALGVSDRTLRNYVTELKELGHYVPSINEINKSLSSERVKNKSPSKPKYVYDYFATNEERLHFLDYGTRP